MHMQDECAGIRVNAASLFSGIGGDYTRASLIIPGLSYPGAPHRGLVRSRGETHMGLRSLRFLPNVFNYSGPRVPFPFLFLCEPECVAVSPINGDGVFQKTTCA